MSSEWPTTTLSEAPLAVIDGDRGANYPKQHEFSSSGHCLFLNAGNVTQDGFVFSDCAFISEEKDSILRKGKLARHDLVLTTRGTVGNVAYFSNEVSYSHIRINSGMVIFRPDQLQLDPYFLYLFLRSKNFRDQVAYLTSGSAQPQLPIRDMNRAEMPLPPLSDQHKICSVLRVLDDRITLLRETNATLEAIAQALFKSWFVDFDPVRAKAEGLEPEGMDAATAALFPDSFEESESGLVPRGWQYSRVENLAEKVGMGPFGSNIKVDTFVSEGIPVISGQHLRKVLVEDSTFNFITDTHAKKLSNSCVHDGDVIFTHAGSIGQVALLHRHASFDRYVLSQRQFFLRCNRLKMQPEWITYYFRSAQGQHQLLANTSQVGVPSIARPVSYLRSIEVLVPSKELIDKFSDIADILHQTVLANRLQIQNLTRLRDTLLPRLISGQLRLPEAEVMVEDVCA